MANDIRVHAALSIAPCEVAAMDEAVLVAQTIGAACLVRQPERKGRRFIGLLKRKR